MFHRLTVFLIGALCLMACDAEHWRIPQFGRTSGPGAAASSDPDSVNGWKNPPQCKGKKEYALAQCLTEIQQAILTASPTYQNDVISDPDTCRAKMLEYRALMHRHQFGKEPDYEGTGVPLGVADCAPAASSPTVVTVPTAAVTAAPKTSAVR